MDQNFNGQNGMVFGGDNSFFSFDPSALDHQPTGQPILNDTEDDFLSTFFNNPSMAQQDDPYAGMFDMGGKSMSQATFSATPFAAAYGGGNLDLDPSQHFQAPQSQSQPHHNMSNHHHQQQQQPSFAGHAGFLSDSPTQTQTMNNADMNAATSLFGIATDKTPTQSLPPNFSHTTNGGQVAGSWGNIAIPNNFASISSSSYPGAPNPANRAPSYSAQPAAWSGSGSGHQAHANSSRNARGSEQYFEYPGAPQANPTSQTNGQQRQFPGVTYGSDPNFGDRYQGPPSPGKDIEGNLLNVPLAEKARGPYGPHAMANQQTNGAGLPHRGSSSQQTASWGNFGLHGITLPPDDEELGLQSRKRQKGQHDGNGAPQWDPRAGQDGSQPIKIEQSEEEPPLRAFPIGSMNPPPSSKRRRASQGQRGPVSNSPPQDDDGTEASARKRGTKKRENLSESQKRINHIHSEKKRREIIQQGYTDLNKLVPCLVSGKSGLSRSECLHEISSYLEVLSIGNAQIQQTIGVQDDDPALAEAFANWHAATARIE